MMAIFFCNQYIVEHLFIFFQRIMLVNGRPFDGSTLYFDTYRRLTTTFGDIHWLPEFQPVRFSNRRIILRLLYLFYCHRVCCFMSSPLVFYSTGVFKSFATAALFIALKDTTIVIRSFGRDPLPRQFSRLVAIHSSSWKVT